MKLYKIYSDPINFSRVVNKLQGLLTIKRKASEDEFEQLSILYIQNKLTEIKMDILFSHYIDIAGSCAVTDVDKVISTNGRIKAIFELKTRRKVEDSIKVNWRQWRILKEISEKLNVPVFYLIKLPEDFCLIKLNFWKKELSGNGIAQDDYVRIPLSEGIRCNEEELVLNLRDILTSPNEEVIDL